MLVYSSKNHHPRTGILLQPNKRSIMKNKIMWAAMLILFFITIELISIAGLYLLRTSKGIYYSPIYKNSISQLHQRLIRLYLKNDTYIIHNKELGWTLRPDTDRDGYRINAQGIRGNREYDYAPRPGKVRISAFGDSFTFCDEVKNHETWEYQLEQQNPELEIINFGVSGFGVDQAWMRYLNYGRKFNSEFVFIGFMPGNTLRHVNVFRPFLQPSTGLPLSKPRFLMAQDTLRLLENPLKTLDDYRQMLENDQKVVPRMGIFDYHYAANYGHSIFDKSRTARLGKVFFAEWQKNAGDRLMLENGVYNPDSEAFNLTLALLKQFYNQVLADGAKPIILIFPSKKSVTRYEDGKPSPYIFYLQHFQKLEFDFIDLMNIFDTAAPAVSSSHFRVSHFSAQGNAHIAQYLNHYIQNIDHGAGAR